MQYSVSARRTRAAPQGGVSKTTFFESASEPPVARNEVSRSRCLSAIVKAAAEIRRAFPARKAWRKVCDMDRFALLFFLGRQVRGGRSNSLFFSPFFLGKGQQLAGFHKIRIQLKNDISHLLGLNPFAPLNIQPADVEK